MKLCHFKYQSITHTPTPYINSIAVRTVFELRQKLPDPSPGTAKFHSVKSRYRKDGLLHLGLEIEVPREDIVNVSKKIDLLAQEMSKTLREPVKVNVDIVPLQRLESQP